MLEIVMILYTVYTLIKVYISVMQIGYISEEKDKEAVLMASDKFRIAGEYAIKKERLGLVSLIVDYAMFVWWVTQGFAWLTTTIGVDNSALDAVIFLFGFMAINYIIGLPFELYQTFELDKEYGFSKMTPKLYILDQFKSIAMFVVLGGGILFLLSWIVINVSSWWIWGFVLLFTIALVVNILYPTIIAPMFNKFSPMEESELKSDIEAMMDKVGLKSDGIFVMDASKRDSR
ncbi:MAG TPA: M48 family peptidase, partial [Campylobacterales bacterium]|nr:M48 family peptidase [Campylobacterales bacterium]